MIIGKTELDKKFDNLSKAELRSVIGKGISLVQEEAKANCPSFDGELRSKIMQEVEEQGDIVRGTCWSAAGYASYVEFGTGPKGQVNHSGISPDVVVAYSQSPWWIHESQIDREVAEHYHFFHIDTPQGRFYQCTGQAAQPYLYPALKNNEKEVLKIIAKEVKRQL